MKKTYLLMASLLMAGGAVAQLQPNVGGELTALLPDGVQAIIDQTKMFQTAKNLTVAGSPEKGYYAFFSATDADHGEELWVTDGTKEGTHMVKDINPGVTASDVQYLTRFNDKVVFSAIESDEMGYQLWISDGTEEGTYMVKQIHEFGSANPTGFCQLNENQFVFFATDFESETKYGDPQQWLYVSDGTEEGTQFVAEVDLKFPGSENKDHRYGAVVRSGRKVYFKADAADKTGTTYGEELWVTDGTNAGTFMIMDINTEANVDAEGSTLGAAISYITNFENKGVFFKAWTEASGNEPWFTDGTPEGTYEIYDTNPTINPETGRGNGGGVVMVGEVYKGQICFRGYTPETGHELGVTNCEPGNFRIFDIFTYEPTNTNNSFPDHGVVFDDRYMFCASTGTDNSIEGQEGGELRMFDGEKVEIQYDLAPGAACDWVKELTVAGGSLYWWNEGSHDGTGATTTKLIRLDAYDQVPVIITNIDANGDQVCTLRNLDEDLLFTSKVNNQVYCYHYRQEGYDPDKNPVAMEPTYGDEQSAVEGVEADAIEFATYPNPAVDAFRIKGLNAAQYDLRIYDMNGRLVRSMDNVLCGEKVDVSDLPTGRYEVTATAEKTGTVSASLVVNK